LAIILIPATTLCCIAQVIAQKHQDIAALFQDLRSHQIAMDERLEELTRRLGSVKPAPAAPALRRPTRSAAGSGGRDAAEDGGSWQSEGEGGRLSQV
jgi:hypothetical protein